MTGALKKSLASWGETHGYLILCILAPEGERFVVLPPNETKVAGLTGQGFRLWVGMSEAEMRGHLIQAGLSQAAAIDAIDLAREWATTVTRKPGSPSVLWGL